jgi:hypothetical protein
MTKAFAQVVTANALRSGRVVWLTTADDWTQDMRHAAVFTDPDQAAVALARAQLQSAKVVGCYLADIRSGPAGPEPTHFRETFRRDGPSAAARIPS